MPRFTVEVTDDQAEFIASFGQGHGWSQRETVRRLIEQARESGGAPEQATPKKKDRRPRKVRVLEAVREKFNLDPAAEAVGVSRQQIVEWCEADPEYAAMVEDAQTAFIADIEINLVAIGLGLKRGNIKALIAFLEAHHPTKYGRLKLEVMLRCLDPILESVMREFREEFSDLPERLDRVQKRIESVKLKRLVAFT